MNGQEDETRGPQNQLLPTIMFFHFSGSLSAPMSPHPSQFPLPQPANKLLSLLNLRHILASEGGSHLF